MSLVQWFSICGAQISNSSIAGNLLEVQIFWPHLDPEPEILGVGPTISVLTLPLGDSNAPSSLRTVAVEYRYNPQNNLPYLLIAFLFNLSATGVAHSSPVEISLLVAIGFQL